MNVACPQKLGGEHSVLLQMVGMVGAWRWKAVGFCRRWGGEHGECPTDAAGSVGSNQWWSGTAQGRGGGGAAGGECHVHPLHVSNELADHKGEWEQEGDERRVRRKGEGKPRHSNHFPPPSSNGLGIPLHTSLFLFEAYSLVGSSGLPSCRKKSALLCRLSLLA